MDKGLLEALKKRIEEIENLTVKKPWGPEYKIWLNTTSKIVKSLFGDEFFKLFEDTHSRTVYSTQPSTNQQYYIEDLDEIKTLLEGFIAEISREDVGDFATKPKLEMPSYQTHEKIREVSSERFNNGQYADAVEAAFKLVIKTVKKYIEEKTGKELDGDAAMNRAFGFESQKPLIEFNSLRTREEKDEQRGIMFLFKGVVGIRNRKAHDNVMLSDPKKAFEYLTLASLLMRLLDEHSK